MCTIIIPIVLITFSLLMTQSRTDNNTIIQYYEKLILNHLEQAHTYEYPEDARIHEPGDETIKEDGTYDFIIIGAGSTGSVIANRLSEVPEWKILVVEAGTYPDDFDSIPSFWSIATFTDYNWGFLSTPQEHSCLGAINRQCIVPRGKGIGGTSIINELIYSRGNPRDFDTWADIVGDSSWKYDFILPYFKKSEDFHPTNPKAPVDLEYHGSGGPLRVNFHMPPQTATQILINGFKELGYDETDYNGKAEMGVTILQIDTKDGKRLDQGSAFIKPVLGRHNLQVLDKSYVIKIEFRESSKEATGIIFTRNNRTYRAKAKREIILSAGTISSPQLLLLSGIGPIDHLTKLNIPVIQDLPVGSTLRDHIFCGLSFSTNFTSKSESLEEEIKEWLYNGTGPLAIANAIDGAAWVQSDTGGIRGYPNLEVVASFGGASELGQKFLRWTDETYSALYNISIENPISLTSVLLHTKSTGTIRLNSSDPFDYPLIDFNFFSDPGEEDFEAIYGGIQTVLKLSQTTAFQNINTTLQVRQWAACQDHEFLSKEYWRCYIQHLGVSAFHPVGSCPSGRDPKSGAVVDSNLKVFGVDRLRVADASVFPLTLSGHPNAPCTMVGEKVSDMIKFEHGVRRYKKRYV